MSIVEFEAALNVYVRTNEEDGSLTDTRNDRVAELAEDKVSTEFLTLMEPSDLAAMLSGSVGVRATKKARLDLAKKIKKNAAALRASDGLPLVAKPDHPANKVLDKLLSCKEGVTMYLAVWAHLTQAKQEGVASIYIPAKDTKREEALITAPVDPAAAGLDEDQETQDASSEEP